MDWDAHMNRVNSPASKLNPPAPWSCLYIKFQSPGGNARQVRIEGTTNAELMWAYRVLVAEIKRRKARVSA